MDNNERTITYRLQPKIDSVAHVNGTTNLYITDNLPSTIVVPLIPSYRDKPYFQQLSKGCFELDKEEFMGVRQPDNRRIHLRLDGTDKELDYIRKRTGATVDKY